MKIDIALAGSQKCLSCPPEFSFLTVSKKAWNVIEGVSYLGYDAILPFKNALKNNEFPYTPSWRGLAALDASLDLIEEEGLENVFLRHKNAQEYTIKRLSEMGIEIFVKKKSLRSPSITAALIPDGWSWETLDFNLRKQGVVFGGSWGKLKDKVFRIGHMGTQADMELLKDSLDILEMIIKK